MAKQRIVHPFADQGNYTIVHNTVFDVLLPSLPPNAFKVLCYIIRQTRGWKRDHVQLSYTEIAQGTGIKSSATLSEAIKVLLRKECIVATEADTRWDATDYRLNTQLELDVFTLETEAAPTSKIKAGKSNPTLETEADTTLETEAAPTSISKESIGKKKREEKKTPPPPLPPTGQNGGDGGGSIELSPPNGKPDKTELYYWLLDAGIKSPDAAARNQHHDPDLTKAMFRQIVGDAIGDDREKRIGRFMKALTADGPRVRPKPAPPPAAPTTPARPPDRNDRATTAQKLRALQQQLQLSTQEVGDDRPLTAREP